jgi:hypothetical protein
MPSKKIKPKWLRFTEETNALDYLEKAYFFIRETEYNRTAWKWVILSLHGALYGFAICALKGTNPERVTDFKQKNKRTHKLSNLPREIKEQGFPENIKIKYNPSKEQLEFKGAMSNNERRSLLGLSIDEVYKEAINRLYLNYQFLISFPEALKRCQDPDWMHMTIMSKHLILDNEQKESINVLKKEFRNKFEHYKPTAWSIEIHGMPQIAIDVLDVIRFLAVETGNYTHLNQSQIRKVKSFVFQSKKLLRNSQLYKAVHAAKQTKR